MIGFYQVQFFHLMMLTLVLLLLHCLKYYCYYNHGRELTNIEAKDWAKIIEKKGAGEIILSSIDREGSFEGIDVELLKTIRNLVKIPVIIHGGCNGPENIFEAHNKTKFEGVIR